MGFFKKIFKGIGRVFKKIGKGIKRAFKKIGKFMNKIGIIGSIAMMFILPGIGAALFKSFGAMAGKMATLTGRFAGLQGTALGSLVKGAGAVMKGAHQFVQTGVNVFKTVTNGITEFAKTGLNKLNIPGLKFEGAATNFFGEGADSVFGRIKMDASKIFDPFKQSIDATTLLEKGINTPEAMLESVSKSTGLSKDVLQNTLGNNFDQIIKQGGGNINLDFSTASVNAAQIDGIGRKAFLNNPELTGNATPEQILEVNEGMNKNLDLTGGVEFKEGPSIDFDVSENRAMDLDIARGTQFQEGSSALNIAEDRPYNIEIDQNSLLSPPSTGAGGTTSASQRIMDRVKDTFGFERDPSQSIIDDAIDYAKQAPGKMMSSYGTSLLERPISTLSSTLNLASQLNTPEFEDIGYADQRYAQVVELPQYDVMGAVPQIQTPTNQLIDSFGGYWGRPSGFTEYMQYYGMPFGSQQYYTTLGNFGRQ